MPGKKCRAETDGNPAEEQAKTSPWVDRGGFPAAQILRDKETTDKQIECQAPWRNSLPSSDGYEEAAEQARNQKLLCYIADLLG